VGLRTHFDLVILDWAGTLVDFGCCAPVAALQAAFAACGVALDEGLARRDMGQAKADHVRAILQDRSLQERWIEARGRLDLDADVGHLVQALGPLMRTQALASSRLIDGARAALDALRAERLLVATSTGYTRDMMLPALHEVAQQGYVPDHLVCSGETPLGRPTPLMIYKACAELGVWPLQRVVKVDDTVAGVAEGRAAGCYTIGISASGNGVGMSQAALAALSPPERAARVGAASDALLAAGADDVIGTIAELVPALRAACSGQEN
jgi:phosphonoacetaldehyde hydrolase